MKRTYYVHNSDDVRFCIDEMQKLNDVLCQMEIEFQGQKPKPYPKGCTDVDMILFYYNNMMRRYIESGAGVDWKKELQKQEEQTK